MFIVCNTSALRDEPLDLNGVDMLAPQHILFYDGTKSTYCAAWYGPEDPDTLGDLEALLNMAYRKGSNAS